MNRLDLFKHFITNKKVLDIGSAGTDGSSKFFDEMSKHTKDIKGIDLRLCSDRRVVQGNAEDHDFKEDFDVVVVGDVIEHLSNQGLFLDNMKSHLKDNGLLIVTVPNVKSRRVFIEPNPEHTAWHDYYTIKEILRRHGFRIMQIHYYNGNKPPYKGLKWLITYKQAMCIIAKKDAEEIEETK